MWGITLPLQIPNSKKQNNLVEHIQNTLTLSQKHSFLPSFLKVDGKLK